MADGLDLEFVDTDDLIEELCRRHDSFVVVGNRDRSESRGDVVWRAVGDPHTLIGLVTSAKAMLLQNSPILRFFG